MKRSTMTPLATLTGFTAAMALLLSPAKLNSQWTPQAGLPPTPEAAMVAVKTANEALLQKQQATLDKLDALQKEANQLRIFTKRG